MAMVVGADRGFVTHEQAVERLLRITGFLETADRYHGAWPHFLSGSTGRRLPVFDQYDNGADLVETSFLMEGLLTARQYFKNDGPQGRALYRAHHEAVGRRGVELVSRHADAGCALLALVTGVLVPHCQSSDWME